MVINSSSIFRGSLNTPPFNKINTLKALCFNQLSIKERTLLKNNQSTEFT